jgi:prepilin-type N-terminal cleavage/methylation domain-containing protein
VGRVAALHQQGITTVWLTKSRAKAGFTFIEILVVTAIMALLLSIAIVAYSQVTRTGRDSKRKKDLATIQTALEIYRTTVGTYPACSGTCQATGLTDTDWIPALVPTYIEALPIDPKYGTTGYNYTYVLSSGSYTLTTTLESGGSYVVRSPR